MPAGRRWLQGGCVVAATGLGQVVAHLFRASRRGCASGPPTTPGRPPCRWRGSRRAPRLECAFQPLRGPGVVGPHAVRCRLPGWHGGVAGWPARAHAPGADATGVGGRGAGVMRSTRWRGQRPEALACPSATYSRRRVRKAEHDRIAESEREPSGTVAVISGSRAGCCVTTTSPLASPVDRDTTSGHRSAQNIPARARVFAVVAGAVGDRPTKTGGVPPGQPYRRRTPAGRLGRHPRKRPWGLLGLAQFNDLARVDA